MAEREKEISKSREGKLKRAGLVCGNNDILGGRERQ